MLLMKLMMKMMINCDTSVLMVLLTAIFISINPVNGQEVLVDKNETYRLHLYNYVVKAGTGVNLWSPVRPVPLDLRWSSYAIDTILEADNMSATTSAEAYSKEFMEKCQRRMNRLCTNIYTINFARKVLTIKDVGLEQADIFRAFQGGTEGRRGGGFPGQFFDRKYNPANESVHYHVRNGDQDEPKVDKMLMAEEPTNVNYVIYLSVYAGHVCRFASRPTIVKRGDTLRLSCHIVLNSYWSPSLFFRNIHDKAIYEGNTTICSSPGRPTRYCTVVEVKADATVLDFECHLRFLPEGRFVPTIAAYAEAQWPHHNHNSPICSFDRIYIDTVPSDVKFICNDRLCEDTVNVGDEISCKADAYPRPVIELSVLMSQPHRDEEHLAREEDEEDEDDLSITEKPRPEYSDIDDDTTADSVFLDDDNDGDDVGEKVSEMMSTTERDEMDFASSDASPQQQQQEGVSQSEQTMEDAASTAAASDEGAGGGDGMNEATSQETIDYSKNDEASMEPGGTEQTEEDMTTRTEDRMTEEDMTTKTEDRMTEEDRMTKEDMTTERDMTVEYTTKELEEVRTSVGEDNGRGKSDETSMISEEMTTSQGQGALMDGKEEEVMRDKAYKVVSEVAGKVLEVSCNISNSLGWGVNTIVLSVNPANSSAARDKDVLRAEKTTVAVDDDWIDDKDTDDNQDENPDETDELPKVEFDLTTKTMIDDLVSSKEQGEEGGDDSTTIAAAIDVDKRTPAAAAAAGGDGAEGSGDDGSDAGHLPVHVHGPLDVSVLFPIVTPRPPPPPTPPPTPPPPPPSPAQPDDEDDDEDDEDLSNADFERMVAIARKNGPKEMRIYCNGALCIGDPSLIVGDKLSCDAKGTPLPDIYFRIDDGRITENGTYDLLDSDRGKMTITCIAKNKFGSMTSKLVLTVSAKRAQIVQKYQKSGDTGAGRSCKEELMLIGFNIFLSFAAAAAAAPHH